MVRPVSNEENLRNIEIASRVTRKSSSEKDGSRNFSYEFRDRVHEKNEHKQHSSQSEKDFYESSEKPPQESENIQKESESSTRPPESAHEGSLDITI